MFEYLKEWSPVFSFIAMVIFAFIVMIIDNRYRKELRQNRKFDEIIRWASECMTLRFELRGAAMLPQGAEYSIEKTKLASKIQRLTMEIFPIQKDIPNEKELKGLFYTCSGELQNFATSLDKQEKNTVVPIDYFAAFTDLVSKAASLKH